MTKWIATFPDESIINNLLKKEKILVVGKVQSGKTKFMIEQTIEAFKTDFDSVIILGGTNNNLLNQTQHRFTKEFPSDEISILEIKDTILDEIPSSKSLLTSLKGSKSLEKLIQFVKNSPNKKIAIFDDESDFGSINTSKAGRTRINELINELFSNIDEGILVSVTATPFADILSSDSNEFSRAHVLVSNEDYTGSKYFLESDSYIVSDKYDENPNDEGISIIRLSEIISDHIERIKESKLKSSQLLINNNLNSYAHNNLYEMTKLALQQLHLISEDESLIEELDENTLILNGLELNSENTIDMSKHSIVIGGHLVSRGFTFEKLLTTIMYNEPLNKHSADTLLQRARWFGYRGEYSKYMKIFITKKTYESLKECNDLLETVYKSLSENSIASTKEKIRKMKFKYIDPTGKKV